MQNVVSTDFAEHILDPFAQEGEFVLEDEFQPNDHVVDIPESILPIVLKDNERYVLIRVSPGLFRVYLSRTPTKTLPDVFNEMDRDEIDKGPHDPFLNSTVNIWKTWWHALSSSFIKAVQSDEHRNRFNFYTIFHLLQHMFLFLISFPFALVTAIVMFVMYRIAWIVTFLSSNPGTSVVDAVKFLIHNRNGILRYFITYVTLLFEFYAGIIYEYPVLSGSALTAAGLIWWYAPSWVFSTLWTFANSGPYIFNVLEKEGKFDNRPLPNPLDLLEKIYPKKDPLPIRSDDPEDPEEGWTEVAAPVLNEVIFSDSEEKIVSDE